MNPTAVKKLLSYRWLIFAVLSLAYFFVYFHRLSFPVVADTLVKEFNTSASTMGLLSSIYFYCYAIMQLPAGLLSDSVGPRRTVTLFLIIASVGSVLFGLAANIQVAFVARILVGFGVSMVFIPTMKILSQWYRKTEFAFMAGILNAVGGAGVLAATWLLAFMTVKIGWRMSFELIGGCTFVVVILVWLVVRDRPGDLGWPSIFDIEKSENTGKEEITAIPLMQGVKQVVSEWYFWPVAIWFLFNMGVFFGFGALWGGPYLIHVYGLSKTEAGAILSMIAWGMIIGSPVLGYLSDKVVKSRRKPLVFCNALLLVEIIIFYLFPDQLPIPVLYVMFFNLAICASTVVILGFTTTKELFPVEMAGTSVGLVNLFPFLGGALYMPFLGKILDYYPRSVSGAYALEGYKMIFLILIFTTLIGLICTLLMKETFPE